MTANELEPEVWQHPHTGEVLLSPQLQDEIKNGLDVARIEVSQKSMTLVDELGSDGRHHPDYLSAALMEAGLQHAIAHWGSECVAAKLRELIGERGDLLDAVLNTPSGIALDRVVSERLAGIQDDG